MKKIVGKENPNEILAIKLEELEELYRLVEKNMSLDKQIEIRIFMSKIQQISMKGNFDSLDIDKRHAYIEELNRYIVCLEK